MRPDSYMLTSKQPLRKSQGLNSSTCAPRQLAMLLEEGGSVKWQQPRHTRKAHGLRRQSPASHTGILALSQHGHLPNGSRNDGDQSTSMSSNKHFIPTVVIVYSLSRVRLFVTPWTVACQAPLSMEFSRQEDWSELPFPSPGDLPNAGIKPASPELADGFFTQRTPSQHLPHKKYYNLYYERVKGEKR